MRRPARRKLDHSEVSWIIEGQITGKYPIRMFSLDESYSQPKPNEQSIKKPLSQEHESQNFPEDEQRRKSN